MFLVQWYYNCLLTAVLLINSDRKITTTNKIPFLLPAHPMPNSILNEKARGNAFNFKIYNKSLYRMDIVIRFIDEEISNWLNSTAPIIIDEWNSTKQKIERKKRKKSNHRKIWDVKINIRKNSINFLSFLFFFFIFF